MKNKLFIHYDEEGDLLELRIGKPTESYFEEIDKGIFERRDEKTNEVKGFKIFGFKKRAQKLKDIEISLPESLEIA